MVAFWKRIVGDENDAAFRRAEARVSGINGLEGALRNLPDVDLANKTQEFRGRINNGETLDDVAPEAFAVIREASRRTLGQRHFDVQLLGGMILHNGDIAEMRTGEGKTLVATLPAYLNALTGKGVHVVTVNDYLSRRDAVWMGQIYSFLGLSVGIINHEASFLYDPNHREVDRERDELGAFKIEHEFLRACTRTEAYAADITYGTNQEFGFDYLRDNIEQEPEKLRQRGHHYAIVDEIDSILIDEARTPLIISAPVADPEDFYNQFVAIASSLVRDEDYTVNEKDRQISLTDSGIERAERSLGIENIYTDAGIKYVHHLETAVRAKALFERDKDYVVKDGQIVIVDEFTGRLQPGRRWSEGLHQAIEAKEGVPIQKESRTFASITYQNYFRLYEKLAGMTGTAVTSSEEFYKVYGLNTVVVPTNKPAARVDTNDLIFQTEQGKFKAIARRVRELHDKGQPVLVGTASVEKNELLSAYFRAESIPHEILNAKNHEREGEIIAQAGKRGAVTIATNMAGRGVDIKLGGNPSTPESEAEIKQLGGLFVLGTERHEARRIDNQLRGRAGRQGDPGETQFFVSLEDQLMRVFASDMVKRMMGTFGIPEDEPIQSGMVTRALEKAQTRIEELHFDARKQVLAYDDVMSAQRASVYSRRHKILTGDKSAIDAATTELAQSFPELGEISSSKRNLLGDEKFYFFMRRILLQSIDLLWVDHLEVMDHLRASVGLRGYGQRDPLVEYKKEGLRLFTTLESRYAEQVAELTKRLTAEGVATVQKPTAMRAIQEGVQELTREHGTFSHGVPEYGRNDRVTVTNGVETKEMKYKKAEELLKNGWQIVR